MWSVPNKCAAVLWLAVTHTLAASRADAQGCEPIRFINPVSLGGEGQAYQPAREWQLTLAFRRLVSNEWFVGTEESSSLAPGGKPPVFVIHTAVAEVAYAINDRYRLRLSVPVSTGSLSRVWPDQSYREQTATGIGDVSLLGEAWILSPRTHERGNVAVGLGVKAPTGSHTVESQFYTATGPIDFPADQTIQPGDVGGRSFSRPRGSGRSRSARTRMCSRSTWRARRRGPMWSGGLVPVSTGRYPTSTRRGSAARSPSGPTRGSP